MGVVVLRCTSRADPSARSTSLKEATVSLGLLTPEEFDQKVRPERESSGVPMGSQHR